MLYLAVNSHWAKHPECQTIQNRRNRNSPSFAAGVVAAAAAVSVNHQRASVAFPCCIDHCILRRLHGGSCSHCSILYYVHGRSPSTPMIGGGVGERALLSLL